MADRKVSDADADMSLAFIEGQADVWAEEIDLYAMIEDVASPMQLNPNTPKDVRDSFTKRMKEQMGALMRQAFIEGAVRAMSGFAPDDDGTLGPETTSTRWVGLRPMDTAPKDGTEILIRFEHPNYKYAVRAGDLDDAKKWEALLPAHWIDFNGGGWTWHGMMGRATGWMPKEEGPPDALPDSPRRSAAVTDSARRAADRQPLPELRPVQGP